MPFVNLSIELPDRLIAGLRTQCDRSEKARAIAEYIHLLNGLRASGQGNNGVLRACIASACATQTVTCTQASAVDNTDTIVIGGTTLTAKTTPTTTAHYGISTTDALYAASMAAAINANATIQKLVRATSATNVVTITAIAPGPVGNLITTTEAGNANVLGQASVMANGASDEVDTYDFGYHSAV